jgi:hypothetical protein
LLDFESYPRPRFPSGVGRIALWGIVSALAPATAQVASRTRPEPTIRFDAVTATSYFWRGIGRSGFPVLQLNAAGGLVWGPVSVTGGIWGSYDRSGLADREAAWSERDLWVQAAVHTGHLTLAGGAQNSDYRRVDDDADATELFGLARWQRDRWAYSVSAWHAIDGTTGTYLEPAITFYHFVNPLTGPAVSLATSLRAGVQVGHRDGTLEGRVPGAEGTGLTHLALSPEAVAAFNLPGRLGLMATISLELAWRRDPATRVRADGSLGSWFGVRAPLQVGVRWPYRRPP